ncbi:MAG: hypothetical protein ACI8XO_000161 [Verrucomicrobiales bacterium]
MKASPPHSARPVINYPWLLAILALAALIASKGFKSEAPIGIPEFVGPPSTPTLPAAFLLKASVGEIEIGNDFAVFISELDDPVVLTAMHRFDPAGGLSQIATPANANTGAPIVGLAGEVLGIHLGAASDCDSAPPYGLAQSTAKFLPHVLQALAGPQAPIEAAMASTQQVEPQ